MRPATSPSMVAILRQAVSVFPSTINFLGQKEKCLKRDKDLFLLCFPLIVLFLLPVLGGFTKQSSECNDGREAGKVEEEEGGNDLRMKAVGEIRQIVRSLPFDKGDHWQLFLFLGKNVNLKKPPRIQNCHFRSPMPFYIIY